MGSRRFAIIAACSGNGKTTLGRELAARLGVPFVELDAWMHQAGWTPLPESEFVARVEAVIATEAWVIDGSYQGQLGTRVLEAADVVVWLDMPLHVWLGWLSRRTARRLLGREELWNGNRETLRGAFWGRDSLYGYALSTWRERRRRWPLKLAPFPTIRLRSAAEVADFLERFAPAGERRSQ